MVSFYQHYVYDAHPCCNLFIFIAIYYTIYLFILLLNTWVVFLLRVIMNTTCTFLYMPNGELCMYIYFA